MEQIMNYIKPELIVVAVVLYFEVVKCLHLSQAQS